jgi:hypothetical protein
VSRGGAGNGPHLPPPRSRGGIARAATPSLLASIPLLRSIKARHCTWAPLEPKPGVRRGKPPPPFREYAAEWVGATPAPDAASASRPERTTGETSSGTPIRSSMISSANRSAWRRKLRRVTEPIPRDRWSALGSPH